MQTQVIDLEGFDITGWSGEDLQTMFQWTARMLVEFTEWHAHTGGKPSEYEPFLEAQAERAQDAFFHDYYSSDTHVTAYGDIQD